MNTRHWLALGTVVLVVSIFTFGSSYWVQARSGHGMNENGHMKNKKQHGLGMENGHHKGMMEMPMMHANMSQEDINQLCSRMQQRHESMRNMRKKKIKKLSSLVETMKQTKGTEKIESMEKVLLELVDQHKKRGRMMMGSMRSMMGSMMGMHRMSDQQRQEMMQQMQDCQMMQGMMNSDSDQGTPMRSPDEQHHE